MPRKQTAPTSTRGTDLAQCTVLPPSNLKSMLNAHYHTKHTAVVLASIIIPLVTGLMVRVHRYTLSASPSHFIQTGSSPTTHLTPRPTFPRCTARLQWLPVMQQLSISLASPPHPPSPFPRKNLTPGHCPKNKLIARSRPLQLQVTV